VNDYLVLSIRIGNPSALSDSQEVQQGKAAFSDTNTAPSTKKTSEGHVWCEKSELPYWAVIWEVSIGLSQALLRLDLHNLHVIELGAGTGIAGITAALRGGKVLLTDYESGAIKLALANAELNGTCVEGRVLDWADDEGWGPREQFDLIIGSEILYEQRAADLVGNRIGWLLKPGGTAIIADPGRGAIPRLIEILLSQQLTVTQHPCCSFQHGGLPRSIIFIEVSRGIPEHPEISAHLRAQCDFWKSKVVADPPSLPCPPPPPPPPPPPF